ncbi:MAG: DnaJ domain-containing protein [Muribaculaceae bacterium]|nr:DnaJ domain-containing protein [Muribaculaceae bacterium]
MFVDYYSILEIQYPSSLDDIRKSYRRLSRKWHPDKNRNLDTSQKMIEINEAYYVLKDIEKKSRYDEEYLRFQHHENITTNNQDRHRHFTGENNYHTPNTDNSFKSQYTSDNYHFYNTKVKNDIKEANQFARELVDEFLKELRETTKRASKGAWDEMWPYFIVILISLIFFALIHACQ